LVKLEEEQEQAESNLTNHQNQIHAA